MVSDNDFRLYKSYLAHYGILGMHWGIRRYQNSDGTLTAEGKKRYSDKLDHDKSYLNELKRSDYIRDNPGSTYGENGKYYLSDLNSYMNEDISYDTTNHKLRSPKDTLRLGKGNCHDQVLLELDVLKRMGWDPKAKFLIEVDSKTGQGGQTHSYVYFKNGNKYIWFENAWEDQSGIHEYDSEKELHDDVMKKFRNNTTMNKIYSGDFDAEPGDTLQQIVNKSLK